MCKILHKRGIYKKLINLYIFLGEMTVPGAPLVGTSVVLDSRQALRAPEETIASMVRNIDCCLISAQIQ